MRSHNEGSLYKSKRGLWVAKVSLPDGRRLERSSKDRTTADRYRREMLRLIGRGVEPKPRLTVAAFLAGWLTDVAALRPQTWERYESVVRVHLVPGLGFMPLQSLRPTVVDRFLATKSGRTAQICREVGRNAYNAALRDRLAEYNPFGLSKAIHHDAKLILILGRDDFARFLEGTADDRLHALYMLAATTALREGELLGLAWSDIDFEAGTLTVRSQLVRLPGEWVLGEPKTRKGRRTIKVATVTMDALRVHRIRMATERRADWEYWQLVFPTEAGQPYYGERIVSLLRGHLFRLGIERPMLRLHDLRHGLASYMKDDGVPDQVLADYLGWTSTRLLERYAHAMPDSGDIVADRMGRMVR